MDRRPWGILLVAGPIEIVPQDRAGLQGVVIVRTANVAGGRASRFTSSRRRCRQFENHVAMRKDGKIFRWIASALQMMLL